MESKLGRRRGVGGGGGGVSGCCSFQRQAILQKWDLVLYKKVQCFCSYSKCCDFKSECSLDKLHCDFLETFGTVVFKPTGNQNMSAKTDSSKRM